jgi:hypothetical protein
MFHYFKIPYFTCNFFTKFTYNEYIGPYFLSHVVLGFSPNELPECPKLASYSTVHSVFTSPSRHTLLDTPLETNKYVSPRTKEIVVYEHTSHPSNLKTQPL